MANIKIETEWEEYGDDELMLRSLSVNDNDLTNMINPRDTDMVIPGSAKWGTIALHRAFTVEEDIKFDIIEIDYRGLSGVLYNDGGFIYDFTMVMFNNREHFDKFSPEQIQSNRYIDKCIITLNRG